nr:MAG TPA: hypothetical protein [Caudoviricetes sp.]
MGFCYTILLTVTLPQILSNCIILVLRNYS